MPGLLKATFDRAVAALVLVLLTPVLIGIAVCLKATGPGPVFVRQERVGRDGRTFHLLGFRHDPGDSALCSTLRRYSIDELPQFVNVLMGHMSFVGPLPAPPSDRGSGTAPHRLPLKPGLTGLGHVSGRSGRFPDDGGRVEADYAENWSLLLDLTILRKTFAAALRGDGAL